MPQLHWKSFALAVVLGLVAAGAAGLHAQNQPDDQRDQRSAPSQPTDHSRDQAPARVTPPSDERRAEGGDNDTVARYRKAHPSAAARCHDGFFTKTTDRSRACSKHGGIDVWLQP